MWTMLNDLLTDYDSVEDMGGTTWDEEMSAAMATVWFHLRQLREREGLELVRRFLTGKEMDEGLAGMREKDGKGGG